MRTSRAITWNLAAALMAALVLWSGPVAAAEPASAIPVFVALQPAGSGLDPKMGDPGDWLDPLGTVLSGTDGSVRVVKQTVLLDSTLAEAAVGAEDWVRVRARENGAEFGVLAKVTQLAGRASVDLRLLPASGGAAVGQLSSQVDAAALVAAIKDLATQARGKLVAARAARSADTADAAPPGVESQPAEPGSGPRIAEIRVAGNRRIDADAVRAVVGSRAGSSATRGRIAEDVRRIHELGFFSDVKVLADRAPSGGGVVLTYQVVEQPVVRQVSISGNENVDTDEITEKLTLTAGSTIDYPLIIENQARIEGFYKTQGYYTAKADYKVETVSDGVVSVNYDVNEGKRLRLEEIEFEGNSFMDDDELMADFQTKPWGFFSFATSYFDNSGLYAEPIFFQDMDKAMRKYQDQGFIRARMSDPKVEFNDDGIKVKVEVDEGPQYRVGKIEVQGDDSMDMDQLVQKVNLQPGAVFNRSMLTDDVERLQKYYADMGFFAAEVRPQTNVDPDTLTVDCVFEASKGDLYFVDKIEVAGNMNTRDDVVRRELSLVEGELYSAAALDRSKARVKRLGFFEEVNIETKKADGKKVDVSIDVVERPTGSFSFGAGASGTDGFILNGSVRQENLFGRGLSLAATADLGSINQRASISFTNPFFLGTPTALTFGFGYRSFEFRDQNDFDQQSLSFNVGGSYPLDEGETRVGTTYGFASRKIDSFDNVSNVLLQREDFQDTTTTSSVGLFWSRDTRDDVQFTKAGQLTNFNAEFAGLGGLSQFLRFEAGTTRYIPLKRFIGWDATFVFNTRFGYVLPFNSLGDFDLPDCTGACASTPSLVGNPSAVAALSDLDDDLELPLSERYFVGGVGGPFQLRGFESAAVGPRRVKLVPFTSGDGQTTLFRPFQRNPDPNGPRCITEDGSATPLGDDECDDVDEDDDFENEDLTEVIGGNKAFVANFEMQFPVAEDYGITGILFFDTGNAFAEDQSFGADLRYSAGVGGRWLSPFGPIIVYAGFPLNPLESEDTSNFEFSFGDGSF